MRRRTEETAWKMLGTGAAIVAGIAARKALESVRTRLGRRSNPPANPASPTTSWGEALTWAAASGLVVGLGRLVAQRVAAAGWQKTMGALPPGLEEVTA